MPFSLAVVLGVPVLVTAGLLALGRARRRSAPRGARVDGGSSLVANWVVVALLLRISDQARRPTPRLDPVDDAGEDSETTQVVKLR